MTDSRFSAGQTALITGGASGIGWALASLLKQKGLHIALIDRDATNLKKAVELLRSADIKAQGYEMDVTDAEAWRDVHKKFQATFGPTLDVLILNAGTAVKAATANPYLDTDAFHKTFDVNVFGVLNGLSTFLSAVQASPKGTIVITGSKQGITNPPGGAVPAYNMSKAAVKILTEHLAYDLRTTGNVCYAPHVSVHLLVPGWTYTGFSGNVGPCNQAVEKKPSGACLPSQCAEYAIQKINEGKFYIICPDGETDEALDAARMLYSVNDIVEERPALSRWHPDWQEQASQWIDREAQTRRR